MDGSFSGFEIFFASLEKLPHLCQDSHVAHETLNFNESGLPLRVIKAIQSTKAFASCLQFSPNYSKVVLFPNPAFVPKVRESTYNCPTQELLAFHPLPFADESQRQVNSLH